MWSQVFLLPKGGSVVADSWQEEEDASESNRESWERSALTWPRQVLHGLNGPLEYFICLNGDPLDGGYDSVSLRTQLYNARRHAWGAEIYVVVDQRYDMQLSQVEARPARAQWFETMLGMGVADLIELPLPLSDDGGPQPKLRLAAARSQERIAIIDADVRPGEWKCIVQRRPNAIQKSFLHPFLTEAPSGGEENYLLVLNGGVRKSHRKAQHEFVIQTADTSPDSQIFVAHVDETGEEPPDELKQLCEDRGLVLVPNSFRGLFELYFFIRRLAREGRRRRVGAWRQEEWSEAVEAVQVSPRPTFESPARPQSLLVTHAFACDDSACSTCPSGAGTGGSPEAGDYCVEAARDFYELTKDLPPDTMVYVHPAVTCEKLTNLLGEINGLTVWVHIGHGKQGEGLQESGCEEYYADPEKWLSCFEKHKGPLSLVCFAACESTAIARYFAEHGAGVSIGFAENVPLEDCRSVARELVKVALTSNGSRNAILSTFERSRHASKAGAVAFCANH